MNKHLTILRNMRSVCYEDVEECNRLKKMYYEDFDCPLNFGKLMTVTVKGKVAADVILILNLIIRSKFNLNFEDKIFCLNKMKIITQRSKIHVYQIGLLEQILDAPTLAEKNKTFYKGVITALYKYILINGYKGI